jgi:very-short-patch-repair endonuclease
MKYKMHFGAKASIFQRAALLRNNPTPAEEILWERLRNNQLGYRFRRQHPMKIFAVDFYCHFLRFVIEVDGSIHQEAETQVADQEKEAVLKDLRIHLLRITNDDVLFHLEEVMDRIHAVIDQLKYLLPDTESMFFTGRH